MGGSVKIGTMTYRVRPIRGRIFLNRREVGALCDHDKQTIRYSSDLTTAAAVQAVAGCVSRACEDAALSNRMFPARKPKGEAADGTKFHVSGQ